MGSYFNYIGVNYFNENINDLYAHIFISKLIKICKVSIQSPLSMLSQWNYFSLCCCVFKAMACVLQLMAIEKGFWHWGRMPDGGGELCPVLPALQKILGCDQEIHISDFSLLYSSSWPLRGWKSRKYLGNCTLLIAFGTLHISFYAVKDTTLGSKALGIIGPLKESQKDENPQCEPDKSQPVVTDAYIRWGRWLSGKSAVNTYHKRGNETT